MTPHAFLRLSFWLGLSTVAGCLHASEQVSDPPLDRSDYELDVCGLGAFSALTPSLEVDFFGRRQGIGVTEQRGEQCAGASDVDACNDALSTAIGIGTAGWTTQPGGGIPAPMEYFVYTRGDEAGAIGAAEVGAFLSPIETAAEAAFLAHVATAGFASCDGLSGGEVPGGYELITQTTYPCGGQVVESRVFVDANTGAATIVETAITNAGVEEICP